MTGVRVHDFGTAFRAYRAETAKRLRLVDGFHRFVPALVHLQGGRITEIPIRIRKRPYGKSHYGLGRIWTVLRDLMALEKVLRGEPRGLLTATASMKYRVKRRHGAQKK